MWPYTLPARRSLEQSLYTNSRPMEAVDHINRSQSPFSDDAQSQSSITSSELLAIDLAILDIECHGNQSEAESQDREDQVVPLSIDLLSLPVDIVALIFCFACEPIRNDTSWRRQCYPLRLASICRTWRQLVLSISELWTTIVVRASQAPGKAGYIAQTELLQQWIERTKGRNIKFYFGPFPDLRLSRRPPSPLLKLLVKHHQQWEIVEFHLRPDWDGLLRSTTESTPLSLTNLRSVLFGFDHDTTGAGRLSTFNLKGARFLQNLSLIGIALERSELTLIPSNQITSISLNSCRGVRLQDLCETFRRLQSASFTNSSIIISHRPSSLEKLKYLTIAYTPDYLQYFRQLTLPALLALEFRLQDCLWNTYTQTFLQFITRSGCRLTSLTLECFITMEYDLIDLLHELPTLEELHIVDSGTTPRETNAPGGVTGNHQSDGLGSMFFELLNPDEATPYLPNLLTFSYKGILAVQAIDFMEPFIVRSQMRGGVRGLYEMEKVAILQQATIVADQYSAVADFSIAEYSDPRYIWEIVRMVEEGVLVLKNMDGSPWE